MRNYLVGSIHGERSCLVIRSGQQAPDRGKGIRRCKEKEAHPAERGYRDHWWIQGDYEHGVHVADSISLSSKSVACSSSVDGFATSPSCNCRLACSHRLRWASRSALGFSSCVWLLPPRDAVTGERQTSFSLSSPMTLAASIVHPKTSSIAVKSFAPRCGLTNNCTGTAAGAILIGRR